MLKKSGQENSRQKVTLSKRISKFLIRSWLITAVLTLILFFYPVSLGISRLGLLAGIFYLWISGFVLLWFRRKIFACILLAISLLSLIFLSLPGRDHDRVRLNEAYLDSLRSFNGTTYIWGGENFLGIDCSGLIRKSMINANLKEGFATFNPALLREAFSIWWHDSSARAIRDCYRGKTKLLFKASSINDIKIDKLEKGDIAVTSSGVHVLAYLGDGEWIEADPGFKKVVIEKTPTENACFNAPVHILRWNLNPSQIVEE